MKHLFPVLSVLFVLFSVLPLNAQPKYVIEWADTLDNDSTDYAQGIAVDGNGNVYVTGYSYIGSNLDYLTVKYDSLGNIVWADTLDNGSGDAAQAIAVDDSGNVYVTGSTNSGLFNFDYFTVKYDSLGNVVWTNKLDNGDNDYAYGIAVDDSGNVYVTGGSNIGSNFDYFTVKYASGGKIVWADTLDNGSMDEAHDIAVDDSGNIYVTGMSDNGSDFDWYTVKYDTSGGILWSDVVDNHGGDDRAFGIAVDGSGNVYVTGGLDNGSNTDYLTVKYDASGHIVWGDELDNDSSDVAQAIAVDGSGNVYVTGWSYIGSNFDYFTVKYDSLRNILWADTLDNGSSDYANGIAVDENGNIYVTGYSYNGSDDDYFTVKYVKYKDAGILSIASPDTVGTDSSYTPQIWVKNNSYQDTLSFDIDAFIDSTGGNLYSDTQSVSNLPVGDSVLVSFSQWTAPSNPVDLNLSFSIITGDMNSKNDNISKTLYVKDMSGILSKGINRRTMLNVSTINKGSISFSYNIAKSGNYEINVYTIDGRIIKKIEEKGSGYHSGKLLNLPSGIYFLRLKQGKDMVNKKVILVR